MKKQILACVLSLGMFFSATVYADNSVIYSTENRNDMSLPIDARFALKKGHPVLAIIFLETDPGVKINVDPIAFPFPVPSHGAESYYKTKYLKIEGLLWDGSSLSIESQGKTLLCAKKGSFGKLQATGNCPLRIDLEAGQYSVSLITAR